MEGREVLIEQGELAAFDSERLLSRRRVAALLDISLETVARKLRAGDIKSVKIGRLRRVPLAEVRRLIAGTQSEIKL